MLISVNKNTIHGDKNAIAPGMHACVVVVPACSQASDVALGPLLTAAPPVKFTVKNAVYSRRRLFTYDVFDCEFGIG